MRGMGVDIVEIARIGRLIEKYADQFLEKIYTSAEIAWCLKAASPEVHFAGRWAVKEAFYKALPLECQPFSMWKSIEVLADTNSRKPCVRVCDDRLKKSLCENNITTIFVSISHERSMCVALVVLE